MATITNYNGSGFLSLVENIGQYQPCVMFSLVPVAAEATANTLSVVIPCLRNIRYAIIQTLDSGNNIAVVGADVTWSGNTLTIADGGSYDIVTTMNIGVIAWGDPAA